MFIWSNISSQPLRSVNNLGLRYEADPVSILVVLSLAKLTLRQLMRCNRQKSSLRKLHRWKRLKSWQLEKLLRILELLPFDAQDDSEVEAECTGVVGVVSSFQNQDVVKESPADWQVVAKRQPAETKRQLLVLAEKQSSTSNQIYHRD